MNEVFKHDSSWMTAGIGRKTNNPGNMRPPRTWKPSVPFKIYHARGNGQFAHFETPEHGIIANVELYARLYSGLSYDALVARWTDGGGHGSYRSSVRACFYS